MTDKKEVNYSISKPGDTIVELLEYHKMTQAELGSRMGKTPSKINDIINGKEPITVNTALLLEKVLGPNPNAQFWLNRETLYREKLARLEEDQQMFQWISWAEQHPLREIKKCGFIIADKGVEAVKQLLLFYGIASPKQWEIVCKPPNLSVNFRKSSFHQTSISALTAWLRIGELQAKSLRLPLFDKDKFRQILIEVKKLVTAHPENFAVLLRAMCAEAGVAIIYTRCLPKAPINGVARWVNGVPIIQLSDRYKTNDIFWFTFYHEAGHILLHGKKQTFLDSDTSSIVDQEKENEADRFASKYLLDDDFQNQLVFPITVDGIVRLAAIYKTHAGVVLGRLQKLKKVDYSFGNHLKKKISLFE
jgi:HTH-type transcriptional regulator/antitoxin HigA